VSQVPPERSGTVVGIVGCGVTGTHVAQLVCTLPGVGLALFDRDAAAAQRLAAATAGVVVAAAEDLVSADVVVLCFGRPHAELAAHLVSGGVATVSLADELADICDLLELHDLALGHGAPLVVGAAMAPGLSGLIARHIATQLVVEELHVAVNGTGGPACARRHHNSLGDKALGWHDGAWIERPGGSGRELCWFPEPMGAHDCYRAALADPLLLQRLFPTASRISARVSATRRDRLTSRLPMLTPPHSGGNIGAVRVEARGALADGSRATVIAGAGGRTAELAAAVCAGAVEACLAGLVPPGAHTPGSTSLADADLLYRATRFGVRVLEFTGVPRPMSW
jgi:hypothetical protein